MQTPIGGERVTFTRRFFGDNLLEGVLLVCTLGVGWLIWLAIVAPKGQTPAKSLLKVYVHDFETGQVAGTGKVWLRDFVWKLLIPTLISAVIYVATGNQDLSNLSGLYTIVAVIMMFTNDANQTLWDKMAGTVVRYHPLGLGAPAGTANSALSTESRLQELDLLFRRNLLTPEEYEAKRREILGNV